MRVYTMQRQHFQMLAVLGVAGVLLIYLPIRYRSTVVDYREMASRHLQISRNTKPISCPKDGDYSSGESVSVIVSTKIGQESVISQTVNSIIAHIHPNLLKEVIIATDSTIKEDHLEALRHEFERYSSLVRIIKSESSNSMKAKMTIGHAASSNIVLFVDDSVVLGAGYLKPLVEALTDKPNRIVVPAFDKLSDITLSVEPTGIQVIWAFDWKLRVRAFEMSFSQLQALDETQLIPTPAFTSKAFALHKSYLTELGKNKYLMDFASSVDLSFTTWTCGDGAYIVPCSRVASADLQVPVDEGDLKQKWAIAERFMTETYKDVFRRVNGDRPSLNEDVIQIENSFQKKCSHSFDWFMSQIVKSTVFTPTEKTVAIGTFDSQTKQNCFRQTAAQIFEGKPCVSTFSSPSELIEFTKEGYLKVGGEKCMKASEKNYMIADVCDGADNTIWETTPFQQFKQGARCLSHATDPYPGENGRQVLMFSTCDSTNGPNMKWQSWTSFIWLND